MFYRRLRLLSDGITYDSIHFKIFFYIYIKIVFFKSTLYTCKYYFSFDWNTIQTFFDYIYAVSAAVIFDIQNYILLIIINISHSIITCNSTNKYDVFDRLSESVSTCNIIISFRFFYYYFLNSFITIIDVLNDSTVRLYYVCDHNTSV